MRIIPALDVIEHLPAGQVPAESRQQDGGGGPGRGRGDLVVDVQVETPRKLSSKQKELLREFQQSETKAQCPDAMGFFERIKANWGKR